MYMQITETKVAPMERVMKMKHAKKPGQYYMIMTVMPKDEKLKTIIKGQEKIVAFVGGLCPSCGKEIFGDVEIGLDNASLVCPNEECKLEFKMGSNNASLEVKN